MTVDHGVAADTLREDISCGEKLVTVHSDDIQAVLDELARLQEIERRARDEADNAMADDAVRAARFILGED